MANSFRTTRRIDFVETDMAGWVHFSNFFRFMESAETELMRSLGLSVHQEYDGDRIGFPRVAAKCDYLSPAHFDDILEISVAVKKIGRKSLTWAFEFIKNQEVIARGELTTVCCRVTGRDSHESIEIPQFIREKLEH